MNSILGRSSPEILEAYEQAAERRGKPVMIIAKTIKGKGVSFLEDRNGWHGKALEGTTLPKPWKNSRTITLPEKSAMPSRAP